MEVAVLAYLSFLVSSMTHALESRPQAAFLSNRNKSKITIECQRALIRPLRNNMAEIKKESSIFNYPKRPPLATFQKLLPP